MKTNVSNCPTNENQCFKLSHKCLQCFKGWGVTKEQGDYTSDDLKVVQVIFL